jgi:hypothetical protein
MIRTITLLRFIIAGFILLTLVMCYKTYAPDLLNISDCNKKVMRFVNDNNVYSRLKGEYAIEDESYSGARVLIKGNGKVRYMPQIYPNVWEMLDSGEIKVETLKPNIRLESTLYLLRGEILLCEDILENKSLGLRFRLLTKDVE